MVLECARCRAFHDHGWLGGGLGRCAGGGAHVRLPVVRILILGAGFGGLELATRLSDELGDRVEVVLIDRAEGFIFGFSKLDVMFGRAEPSAVFHPYADVVKPGVRFERTTVRSIDPVTRTVTTDAGVFDGDILVVALGADLHPEATPGLVEGGNEFYTVAGAFALRDVLAEFDGGRVIIGVTSTPFKCPPAPSETALLMHDHLIARGVREQSSIALVMPLGVPIPPSPAASQALLTTFTERGIDWHAETLITSLDPGRKVAITSTGAEMAYDLFLGVPVHRVPAVVAESGMTVNGWIPVDPLTLATSYPGVYAVGDVTSVGTPKAGVFAEGQAGVVADEIIAIVNGAEPTATYDGRGMCYLEFGHDQVAQVNVTFVSGQAPYGDMDGPSVELAANKQAFGAVRIRRWFDRSWDSTGSPVS
jgi:sulfide:quinone oxidoreductase